MYQVVVLDDEETEYYPGTRLFLGTVGDHDYRQCTVIYTTDLLCTYLWQSSVLLIFSRNVRGVEGAVSFLTTRVTSPIHSKQYNNSSGTWYE